MRTVLFICADENHSRTYTAGLREHKIGLVPTGDVRNASGLLHHFSVDAVIHHLTGETPDAWQDVGMLVHMAGSTPVLLLARTSSPEVQRRALNLGCAGVAYEPCVPAELAEALRKLQPANA